MIFYFDKQTDTKDKTMDYFELTFRFDNPGESFTRFNGLTIKELAEFLDILSQTMPEGNKMVLSEVKGNCYAPVISTPVKTEFEQLKSLHSEIEAGNYGGLTSKEKKYYRYLSAYNEKGFDIRVYDDTKTYYKNIVNLVVKEEYPYYYSTAQVTGVLTRIGNRNLDSKNTIIIDNYPYEIEVTREQETRLKSYFKDHRLELNITEKINRENRKIMQAVLNSFDVITEEISFYEKVEQVRERYGANFLPTW